jgi:hypothetical protein
MLLGVRSRVFWLLAATFFICGLSTNGLVGTHLITDAVDHHMTAVAGATRGWFGSYTFAFMSAGAVCLLAAGLSLSIGRPARRPLPVVEPAPA